MDMPLTQEILAALLRDAEAAHAEYEKTLGKRDEHWPEWYAKWIFDKMEGYESNMEWKDNRRE